MTDPAKTTIESEGTTIDDAIERGLAVLGAARESVRVEILRDARRGILGFGGQSALVRLTRRERVSGIEEEPTPSAAAPAREEVDPAVTSFRESVAPPRVEEPSQGAISAHGLASELLRRMNFEVQISEDESEEDGVQLRIESDRGGLLIGKHGQTLDAFEYLLNRMLARQDGGRAVMVDVGGYRERRRQSIEEMARSLAERAKKRGRPETLAPMSPRDRRVVHVALRDDDGVTTRSLGQGHLRRVVIAPARRGHARDERGAAES